jgi:uncharacterized protein YdhG (YjbR/CyaY superfamily)
MPTSRTKPKDIDEYIAAFPPEVRAILQRIRLTIHGAAPDAAETISYQIPAFTLSGTLGGTITGSLAISASFAYRLKSKAHP